MDVPGILLVAASGLGLIAFLCMHVWGDVAPTWMKASFGVMLGLAIIVAVIASCYMMFSESSQVYAY